MDQGPALERERDAFERAFVATSYLCQRRGKELVEALADGPGREAAALAVRLDEPLREQRARALAPELARIAASLDALRFD
jgi:hypothetical protein